MHVRVGPVPSGSVAIWIAYARTVLAQAMTGTRVSSHPLPTEVIEAFEQLLTEWEELAERDLSFVWEAELDVEQVTYLLHAFFDVASGLAQAAQARGFPVSPPEGDEFYRALVLSLLGALELEGGPYRDFAIDLRARWPGLKEEE
ncbi:MAG: hypothetical protein N2037_08830 [Acidimicrobiales bacterium]|nr:hypothetical protein [Acidimicrobiales bacterium]